jgi:hypothetical protein
MNHDRMFNHLSQQFLAHLGYMEEEKGFRLDKNMMHIPGSRKPMIYESNFLEFTKNSNHSAHLDIPAHTGSGYSEFEMSAWLPRESGPPSYLSANRTSGVGRPDDLRDTISNETMLGMAKIKGDRLQPGDWMPGELAGGNYGEREYVNLMSMSEAQRDLVDDPDLADWDDLPEDNRVRQMDLTRRFSEIRQGREGNSAVLQPESFNSAWGAGKPTHVSYEADFDPGSRQFSNPMVREREVRHDRGPDKVYPL